ncbi:MAG TPA: tetratricopeptide repeat protein [Terriglobales bacterium]|nr:tetratricopeptide repeat protein [Terriglobales bacterium]
MATQSNQHAIGNWTSTQAYLLAIICLVAGVAIGYLLRGSESQAPAPTAASLPADQGGAGGIGASATQPTPEQMRHMADKKAEPLLAQLKSNPNDPKLLYDIGNIYYDTQQFPEAIKYYEQSLSIDPKADDVRTDMAVAYFYSDDVDKALSELDVVLKQNPAHTNALFNQGMIRWKGKMDITGAIASWKKLLQVNPNYERRTEVEAFIAQAEKHANMKPGQKTNKPTGM